jgi:hypothetical protein
VKRSTPEGALRAKLQHYNIKSDLDITPLDEREEKLFVAPKIKLGIDIGRLSQEQWRSMVESYAVFGTKLREDVEKQAKKARQLVKTMNKIWPAKPAKYTIIDDVKSIVNYPLTSGPQSLTNDLRNWFTGNLLTKEAKS